jgi:hypothetical protein
MGPLVRTLTHVQGSATKQVLLCITYLVPGVPLCIGPHVVMLRNSSLDVLNGARPEAEQSHTAAATAASTAVMKCRRQHCNLS